MYNELFIKYDKTKDELRDVKKDLVSEIYFLVHQYIHLKFHHRRSKLSLSIEEKLFLFRYTFQEIQCVTKLFVEILSSRHSIRNFLE